VEHSEEETGPGLKGILRACCGMVLGRELKSLYQKIHKQLVGDDQMKGLIFQD